MQIAAFPNKDALQVEIIRFEYEVGKKAAKAIEESPLPDEYPDMLRRILKLLFHRDISSYDFTSKC